MRWVLAALAGASHNRHHHTWELRGTSWGPYTEWQTCTTCGRTRR